MINKTKQTSKKRVDLKVPGDSIILRTKKKILKSYLNYTPDKTRKEVKTTHNLTSLCKWNVLAKVFPKIPAKPQGTPFIPKTSTVFPRV